MQRNTLIQFLVACAALVIILAGVKAAVEIVVPFLLSLFIAIICSPVIKWMTERKVPHWLAISILFLAILVIFFFLVGLINSSIREFSQSIPQYKVLLAERVNYLIMLAKKWNLSININKEVISDKLDPSAIMNFVSSLLMNFSNVVSSAFVLILVVVFMLLEAPTAKYKLNLLLRNTAHEQWEEDGHLDRILEGIIRYLGVKSAVSLLTGILVWALLEIMNVQYAVLWATLTFLLNYIPNVGSIIAAVPIILQAFLLNGFVDGFIVAGGVIGINMIVGNVVEPKMMGRTLGLSTLVVFLSLLFWGWLLGTVGMLLSVPLTIALKIVLESSPSTQHYAVLLGNVQEEIK
ncbi:MAG: AI-2E family transporter [Lonepinella koalarum]|nr:AI-2E family transporter [Lonepinella koalarum]